VAPPAPPAPPHPPPPPRPRARHTSGGGLHGYQVVGVHHLAAQLWR
jgi:hypothetical protein